MPPETTESSLRNHILDLVRTYYQEHKQPPPFVPGQTFIPASTKSFDASDLGQLVDAALDMWITAGKNARTLELELGKLFRKTTPALLVNSGSSANLVAASVLGTEQISNAGYRPISPGEEVITVASGFPTTVNPIVQNGWIPVFVDVERETLNASLESIQEAISKKTRAVFLAHPLGNPARMDLISKWCDENSLFLIEDCCDSLGASIGEERRPVGSYGHFATLSFYPSHHITTGEGGALVAKSAKLRKIAESLRDWGRDCWCEPGFDNTCKKRFDWNLGTLPAGYDHKYTYSTIGYNFKMTDLQAALGVSQLKKLDSFVEKRNEHWQFLYSELRRDPVLNDRLTPVEPNPGTNPSWFAFPVHCNPGVSRHAITRYLESHKVGTRLVFAGNIIHQPAYKNVKYRISGSLNNTDRVMNETFWISCTPTLTREHMEYMLGVLKEAVCSI